MMDELFTRLVSDIRIDGGRPGDGSSGPSIDQRRRIAKLDTLRHSVERRFRTPAAREGWLHAPLSSLSGRSPMDALTDGDIDAVLKLL
ncbi:MAG: antitoxin Xre/MbcA/ParS toxin-binding domain-containing protein [Gemmatimonadaceae bacterium]